jgi:hypothetical protein
VNGNRARYLKVGVGEWGEWRGRLVLCGWAVPSAFLANQDTAILYLVPSNSRRPAFANTRHQTSSQRQSSAAPILAALLLPRARAQDASAHVGAWSVGLDSLNSCRRPTHFPCPRRSPDWQGAFCSLPSALGLSYLPYPTLSTLSLVPTPKGNTLC